jgi:hypothetical protein
LDYEPSITPEFGYRYAFEIPEDWLRTAALCSDEYFRATIRSYQISEGHWWCDLEQIYVRYMSNGDLYGLDYSLWPENFTRYVESFLAFQACNSTTYADKRKTVEDDMDRLLSAAKASDAMEQPSPPQSRGSWSSARASSGGDAERGVKSYLTS